MDKATAWLRQSFDYDFEDADLLRRALTHRSAPGINNERMEFLGDAVLQLVVSEFVFEKRASEDEGTLSRIRSSLVKDTTLAELATTLGVGRFLVLGPGEKKTGGHRRASILADALEALIAAVYLDAGFAAARHAIHHIYAEKFANLPQGEDLRDAKTRLQEILQARKLSLPEYEVVATSGKAHQQVFDVRCRIDALSLESAGRGASRREAEQTAAAAILLVLEGA